MVATTVVVVLANLLAEPRTHERMYMYVLDDYSVATSHDTVC